jgi:hypothetical protein
LIAVLASCFIGSAISAEAQIQVNSADPSAAEQGTVNLNVTIGGKGFKNGAAASFVLTGTDDPDGITVNSTTFVSSTTLVANISVADGATVAKFDIKVRNSDGRIGKGTELFSVLQKGTGQTILDVNSRLTDTAGFTIQSDGLNGGWYFSTSSGNDVIDSEVYSDSGDWVLDTLGSTTRRVLIILNPVSGNTSGRPFEAAVVRARLINCNAPGLDTDSFWDALPGGATIECNLRVRFLYNRKEYVLLMNGTVGTSRTTVACVTAEGTVCDHWTSSLGTPEAPGQGMLQSVSKNGTITDLGLYYVSYSAEVVRP